MSKGENMREIKFRGKNRNGNWHYGLLTHDETPSFKSDYKWFISNSKGKPYANGVIEETICQFTGLYDKNGKEIYEGDIVVSDFFTWEDECIVKFGAYYNEEQWEDSRSGYGWYTEMLSGEPSSRRELNNDVLEVVGNIHEEELK